MLSGRVIVLMFDMVTLVTRRHKIRLTAIALAMESGSALMIIRTWSEPENCS